MDIQPLVRILEVAYLKRIAVLIERRKIDLATAKVWSNELLALLPFTSFDDLKEKIKQFSLKYPLLENLPLVIDTYVEGDKSTHEAEEMETLIKNQKLEEALQLVK